MTYNIKLNHDDFILILHTLREAQNQGIVNWSATDIICENTKVEY